MITRTGPSLAWDDAELATCVSCGLCLPACPTWRVTGLERASPRGRIAAMRAVQWEGAPVDAEFASMMEECVQCRGCEPVCPAFVPFGHLMERARARLREERAPAVGRSRVRAVGEWAALRVVLVRPAVLLMVTWVLWVLQRLRLLPGRLGVPRLRAGVITRALRPSAEGGEPVSLFLGCVMNAWMRDTHRSAQRVIEAAGGSVRLPGRSPCCGALHAHAGRLDEARALARRVVETYPGDAPILVDSAGCGAAMKDYGRLLGTPEAQAFAARVRDVHEWLAGRTLPGLASMSTPVVVQDACHLRHVQRVEGAVRTVLGQAYELMETDDLGLCCGAGGAFAVAQPDLAGAIRDRKIESLRRVGGPAPLVASANPGCVMHLRAGGVDARHPLDLLALALETAGE